MSFTFKKNPDLEKLEKIITLDFSSKSPTIAYINPDALANTWILVAFICTPYILWLLFKLKKFGWLISFTIFVIAPFTSAYFIFTSDIVRILVHSLALLNIVVFLFILKTSYKDWRDPEFKNDIN